MSVRTEVTVGSVRCGVCGIRTCEGKPYCTNHLDQLGTVQEVLAELGRRAEEIRQAANGSHAHIDVRGSVAADVVGVVSSRGRTTVRRVSRECNLPMKAAENYAKALVRARILLAGQTKRGDTTIELP